MRRSVFHRFAFKLVCCRGPCPRFARKRYPEGTTAQGATCYEHWQPPGVFTAAVHQHPVTGNVGSATLEGGKSLCHTFVCQRYRNLRLSLGHADRKGKRCGLTCPLAHCNQKQFVERKQAILHEWFCQIVNKVCFMVETHILDRRVTCFSWFPFISSAVFLHCSVIVLPCGQIWVSL